MSSSKVLKFFLCSAFVTFSSPAAQLDQCTNTVSSFSKSYVTSVNHWLDHIAREKRRVPPVSPNDTSFILPDPTNAQKIHPTERVAVLVHGLGDSPAIMRDLAQIYVDQGFTVIGVRLSGHGTAKKWDQNLRSAMKTAHGLGNEVSLVGYSLGGALALNYALKDRVNSAYPQKHPYPKVLGVHDLTLIAPLIDFYSNPKSNPKSADENAQAKWVAITNQKLFQAVESLPPLNPPKPAHLILDSADTTVSNDAALTFAKNSVHYGLALTSTTVTTTIPHDRFPQASANPGFLEITTSLEKFIRETHDLQNSVDSQLQLTEATNRLQEKNGPERCGMRSTSLPITTARKRKRKVLPSSEAATP